MEKMQFDYLRGLMEAMVKQQFPTGKEFRIDPEEVRGRVVDLMNRFESDWEKFQNEATTKAEREKIEKNLDSLAKALPGITKGTLSAVTAFKNGDNLSGSAAIMDICASLAPLLAGLSAAGGPPGMLVGAIFSLVGQILSFFSPRAESLTSQIDKLLRDQKAEETQQHIVTVRQNIRSYVSSLRKAANMSARAMGKDEPLLSLMVTRNIVAAINPLEGNTLNNFENVMNWLNEPKNQTLDLWPSILSAACQAWADLMTATLTLLSFAHTDEVQRQYDRANQLPDSDKADFRRALLELRAEVIARLVMLDAKNGIIREILPQLLPAVQNRGMFWMIGTNSRLYAGTQIKQGDFPPLGGAWKNISVASPKKEIGLPRPTYFKIGLEYWATPGYDRTYISQIKHPYKDRDSKPLVNEKGEDYPALHALSDVCVEAGDQQNNLWFYTAKGNVITGYEVNTETGMDKARPTSYSLTLKADVKSVRVLHNPDVLLDDPDNTKGILTDAYCVYGGLVRENSEIYADISGHSGYVPSPWTGYDGLGVDRHYLWVFGSGGVACATHASIKRCLKGEIREPRWLQHWPTQILYTKKYFEDEKKVVGEHRRPLLGLVDVCPCDDGTFVAALYVRSVIRNDPTEFNSQEYYSFTDSHGLYTAAYQTDLKKKTIAVDWTKIEGSDAVRVHKLPVYCWSQFERLPGMVDELDAAIDSL